MANLLCLLWRHWRTPVVFATNRFYCRRCGLSLDPDPTPEPTMPSTAARTGRLAQRAPRPRGPSHARHRPVR